MLHHGLLFRLAASLLVLAPCSAAELKPRTAEAFERYVRDAERRIDERVHGRRSFLWADESAERKVAARASVVVGAPGERSLSNVPDGLIHHWVGAAFLPGVSLPQTLALLQDYDNHARIYPPEVAASKLLGRSGNDFRIHYRLLKKKVITVVLNTEHEVRYFRLDDRRWHSRSYTTKIAEVENAGKAGGREMPVGNDNGFLWRLYSYWRFAERDGGVWIECEAISLTRDIPTGLGWLVKPVIQDLPRESLTATLQNTYNALVR